MYLVSLAIENVKSIKKLSISFPATNNKSDRSGWHVLLGDNGSGKTTLARAIAIVLAGANETKALRRNWLEWISDNEEVASVRLNINYDKKYDKVTGRGRVLENYYLPAKLTFKRTKGRTGEEVIIKHTPFSRVESKRYLWGEGSGWFCSSYGPYRRFSGGNKDYEKLFYSNPRLAPHLSIFGEDIALTECLEWLTNLHVDELEKKEKNYTLQNLKTFINHSGLLPHGTKLFKITSKDVIFKDGNGCKLPVDGLSDGYRSILSLTFELIRQLNRTYGEKAVFQEINNDKMQIVQPGVVVIDEIDAHLHPNWQIRIGEWFTSIFPNLQFIVTTHSPLICQSAVKGSVWRLPTPGTDEQCKQVKDNDLSRLLFGTVLEAYGTGLFGNNVGRSIQSQKLHKKLAQLNRKSLKGKLTKDEKKKYIELISILPSVTNLGTDKN